MEALEMIDGRFKYRLIVLCWMRGEGKSLLVVLIQLWKFFNWPRQQIVLGANSKDQTKFVHYDMIRDIILNSPNLLATIGRNNVQDKEIRLKDADGTIRSVIKPISTASGIVSNITGYTFSEMFDMRNPKFFTQLDGSMRNIPNALGLIDSTVSEKSHILYKLYQNFVQKKTKTLYFSYRFSDTGVQEHYWNPFMTTTQLEDYRAKFLEADFARYFLNVWSAGSAQVFTQSMIDEMGQFGVDGRVLNHFDMVSVNENIEKYKAMSEVMTQKRLPDGAVEQLSLVDAQKERVTPMSKMYALEDNYSNIKMVSPNVLIDLGDRLNTDWAILAGIDLADPLAKTRSANSVMVLLAKGLPNSRVDPSLMILNEKEMVAAKFIYFIIGFYILESKTPISDIRKKLDEALIMYDGLDMICGERYGLWDLATWAEDVDVPFSPIYPNYERQRAAFNHLYSTMHMGLLKSPPIPVMGVKGETDLLREELGVFDHNTHRRWFGSPEKKEKGGIQDDSIYALGWGMYGGKNLGPEDFRSLSLQSGNMFGSLFQNKEVLGNY
ncbi:MAG: hypothetical protein KAH38_08450 [Candidatus Hydrogenedentes bacterium]|nr:hypothetical protein [Candidatus Hydrogenedentota bacterium]